MIAISYDLTDEPLGWNCYYISVWQLLPAFPYPGHPNMPFIPCGFGDNWLLRNPSPAAISTQRITILVEAIRDLKKTRPRRQARVLLNGDLRVKCFFLFPAANDSHSASAVHHTAWANNDVRLHVYGWLSRCFSLRSTEYVLPNIAFSSIFCCRSTPYSVLRIVLLSFCLGIAMHFTPSKRQHLRPEDVGIGHLAQRFCRIGISSHIVTHSRPPSLTKDITSPPELPWKRR